MKLRDAFVVAIYPLILINCGPRESNTVRIGCITPLTGDGADYGAATKRGVDLAKEKVNNAGGVNGKPLQVIYEDDQMSGRIATNALEKLITIDRVPVIIGAFGSSVTLAIAPIAEKSKVVLLSASSTADAIKDAGDYIFRDVPTNRNQGKTAALFAAQYLHARSASILYMNNDYGVSLTEAFQNAFPSLERSILSVDTYNPGITDFRAQLTSIRGRNPDVIFYPGHYQESALILRQAKELGLKSTFIGGDGSYAPDLIKIAGKAAEGSYYALMAVAYGGGDPVVNAFVDSFKVKYHQDPDVYSAYAYDAMLIIANAINTGGYSAGGIKTALYNTHDFKGVTGITRFDSNGEVDKPFAIYEVVDGKFVPVTQSTGGTH